MVLYESACAGPPVRHSSLCSAEQATLRLAGTLVAVPAQVVDRVVGEEAVSEEVRAVATHLVCRSALQICTLRSPCCVRERGSASAQQP